MDLRDALAIIEANYHCTIASATLDGVPWVTPVFFNYDDNLRFVWESDRSSRHAQNIAANPRVAIVVANLGHRGAPAGVYIECTAREVPVDGIEAALALFAGGPHEKEVDRRVSDYLGEKPLRLYEALPHALFGLTQVSTPDGYEVDQRVEIPLPRAVTRPST